MNDQLRNQRRAIHAYNEAHREAIHAAERERFVERRADEYTDSPLPAMLVWAGLSIITWLVFGWAVVTAVRWWMA